MKKILCITVAVLLFLMPAENIIYGYKSTINDAAICSAQSTQNAHKRHENAGMKIALTFDDGPHPVYTPQILDILAEFGVKATFFVIGENAEYYPEIIERIVREGHEIGNHTYRHFHLKDLSPSQIKREIELCEKTIYEICEYRTKLFRPPEGYLSDAVCRLAEREDYSVILWSVDTHDWAHKLAGEIFENVKKRTRAGDIILMHDYIVKSTTPDALRLIIPYLIDEGNVFSTVSELIGSR